MNQGQGYAKGIAEKLCDKRQSINPLLNKLEEKELIEPIGKSSNPRIYEMTGDGIKALMQVMKTDKRQIPRLLLRTHKINIRYPLNAGHEQLNEEDLNASKTVMRNWTRFDGELDTELSFQETIRYQITPGSLVIKIPEIITHCTCEGVAYATLEALRKAEEVKETVKDKAPYLKFGRAEPMFSDRHYAFEAHPNALMLDQYDIKGL
ncbi:MAG: hypothetical protein ABEJ72_02470, partial [Candidatus Aenigmatarchaeota archaeon]